MEENTVKNVVKELVIEELIKVAYVYLDNAEKSIGNLPEYWYMMYKATINTLRKKLNPDDTEVMEKLGVKPDERFAEFSNEQLLKIAKYCKNISKAIWDKSSICRDWRNLSHFIIEELAIRDGEYDSPTFMCVYSDEEKRLAFELFDRICGEALANG